MKKTCLLNTLIPVLTICLFTPICPAADIPRQMNYQGYITSGGSVFTGTGYFKFALVNSAGLATYWSNDGTSSGGSEPSRSITTTVSSGVFNVILGDTNIANMTAIDPDIFTNYSGVYLRVWFSSTGGTGTFELLTPDRRITSSGYAFNANTISAEDGIIKYNITDNKWQYTNDGTTWNDVSAGTGDFKADGSVPMTGNLNMGTKNITNAGTVNMSTLSLGGTTITATGTELNYVDGVTSAIQTQIDSKQGTITGAATTIASSDLTASRALESNASGKVSVSSTVDSTELGYLNGVTSSIQTQIDAKASTSSPTFTGNVQIQAQGDLRLADSDSSNYVAFQAPATVSSNVIWTLPSSDGSSNQVLSTNGSGTLSWGGVSGLNGSIVGGNWEVASNGLSVNVEELDVTIGGTAYNKTASSVTTSGLTVDTWYYIYAYVSGGAITYEVSTTAPDSRKVWKNGTTTYKYMGALRTYNDGGTVRVMRAKKVGNATMYLMGYTLRAIFGPVTPAIPTAYSCATHVPPTSRMACFEVAFLTETGTLYCNDDGNTEGYVDINGTAGAVTVTVPLDTSQQVYLKCSGGNGNVYFRAHIFYE